MLPGRTYTITDFVTMAWRRRWIILIPFVAGIFGSLVFSSRLPDQYQSETLIQIVPQQVPNVYVQSTVTMRTEDRLNALRQQVLSRTELERLIIAFDLYTLERARLPMQDVVELMRANTAVDPVASPRTARGDNADAFYIRFTYKQGDIAAKVTERLGSLFIDQNARDRGALAEATDDFLQTQLAESRKQLEVQEQKLEQFRVQHAGRLPSQLGFNMQAIQNAQMQLQANTDALARDRDRKMMLERLYNDAQVELDSAVPQPGAASAAQLPGGQLPVTATAQERLAAARSYLVSLELTRKPEHPDVIRAKRVIADLEKKEALASAERKEPAESLQTSAVPTSNQGSGARRERLAQMRAEIESLDRQIGFKQNEEKRLQSGIAEYQQRIEAVPGTESEWTALSRDYDTQQSAYKDLLSKSAQAKVASNLERRQVGEQFRILDRPRVPTRPVAPDRLRITGIGTAAGLLFGLVLAALKELRDATFRNELDVANVLALPVVAVVPYIKSQMQLARERRLRLAASGGAGAVAIIAMYVFWALKLWRYAV